MPLPKVDVIVSEWMGYCLLYEAMLDSVLWARDHYLASDGLMIPSHTTLRMAPLSDPDYITEHVTFWRSVYGFSMTSMLTSIHDDVSILPLPPGRLGSTPVTFLELPLHEIQRQDLSFVKPFQVVLDRDLDELDGWVIWFDTFFMPSRESQLPASGSAEKWTGPGVAFTTGPGGPETHWKQGVLLIDHQGEDTRRLRAGTTLSGQISYRKRKENSRELEIEISWEVPGEQEKGRQMWVMR
ncbi:MAG: hypothetical protein M1833_002281 [Piccolia ochrophora]|nr:MAG: hypothetical protein M1833_002281 [Piccolia ochrophora]